MSHSLSSSSDVRNPGRFQTPVAIQTLLVVLATVGVGVFLFGLASDTKRAWASFLVNHFFFLSLGFGGLVFAVLQWLTGAMWSAPIRRLAESFSAYIPVAFVMTLVLFAGMSQLYSWMDLDYVQSDLILKGKMAFLNPTFFKIRSVVGFLILGLFGWKMIRNSLQQDQSKDVALTFRNKSMAPLFMISFALIFTSFSFDFLMSLEPHWFSTMYGVYCFAGLLYSTFATLMLLTLFLKKEGVLQGVVGESHIHDLGKFMFAFTAFWAYIGFSQYMLIWYANLPEETFFYMDRQVGGWYAVGVFLMVGKFAVPFAVLMSRTTKTCSKVLVGIAIFMLVAQWIDIFYQVQPNFFKDGPRIGWIELGVTGGFLGLFGLSVFWFLARNNVVAIGDPRLAESVHHHHT